MIQSRFRPRLRVPQLLLILALSTAATTSFAADEAVTHFERGVQLYEAQNFDGALVEFNAAYKLSKNYKLLYNIGICQMAVKDYAAAADAFKQYLSDGGSEPSEARVADVKDRLNKLALMVTTVRVTTDAPTGTTVLVDDKPIGTAPINDPVTVKIGRRVFSLNAHGRTVTKSVDLGSGENPSVSLMLGDGGGGVLVGTGTGAPASGEGAAPVAAGESPSFPWAMWGLTAVVGGAAAVSGAFAIGAANDLKDMKATYGTEKSALDDQQSQAKTLGYVTDGLLVGTVLFAGLSTYFTIRYFTAKKSPTTGLVVSPMGVGYTRSF